MARRRPRWTIDTLTGEMKVLRVDILHDVGRSLNPAIDRGQIEGGFIQGMGWLTTEELVLGRRRAAADPRAQHLQDPGLRRPPADQVNVRLWEAARTSETIHRSKAVGEPPLMLGGGNAGRAGDHAERARFGTERGRHQDGGDLDRAGWFDRRWAA
jgi:xanthine dehydrogenase molybdopterin-binding subunit B